MESVVAATVFVVIIVVIIIVVIVLIIERIVQFHRVKFDHFQLLAAMWTAHSFSEPGLTG
jgi:hypothetical protein